VITGESPCSRATQTNPGARRSTNSVLTAGHPFEGQLLHSGSGLRDIEIAFRISRDLMARSYDAGRLDIAHNLQRFAP
jgi:hypothetical protein